MSWKMRSTRYLFLTNLPKQVNLTKIYLPDNNSVPLLNCVPDNVPRQLNLVSTKLLLDNIIKLIEGRHY